MRCIGSRLMQRAVPEEPNDEARSEGNAADWLADQLFAGIDITPGTKAPNGWAVTGDMLEYISQYVADLGRGGDTQVVTTWGTASFEIRGRADHIGHSGGTLTVDDLKYGHRIVSPVENWTLLSHAIGWCIINGVQPDRVVLRIHQPRPYHTDGPVRSWEVPSGYAGLVERYQAVAAHLSNPTDALVSGPDWCAKCHGRFDCPALDRSAWSACEVTLGAFNDAMPSNALAFERDVMQHAADVLKIKIDAVDELMSHRIRSGQMIPGYGLENRLGQRRWSKGLTGKVLSISTGVDLTSDGVVTPAEAERRGVSKDVIAALTERPNIGAKLKKIDPDAVARRAFGERT